MRDIAKQRRFQREWMAKRRKQWFDANGPCCKCGSWEKLELDHIDRTQKVTHRVWSWTSGKRQMELNKCQVLCQRCHKLKNYGEKLRGEDMPNAKLTETKVLEIRLRRTQGATYDQLGKDYGVSKYTIRNIVKREKWKHI